MASCMLSLGKGSSAEVSSTAVPRECPFCSEHGSPPHSPPILTLLPCELPPQNSTQLLQQLPNTHPGAFHGPPLVVPPHPPPPPSMRCTPSRCLLAPPAACQAVTHTVFHLSQPDLPREDRAQNPTEQLGISALFQRGHQHCPQPTGIRRLELLLAVRRHLLQRGRFFSDKTQHFHTNAAAL